jgi:1,4-alpha-glucan branching enzyme
MTETRVITDFDLYLFGEGTLHRAFDKLGAHRQKVGGVTGVHFAVWAPNAAKVSVIGISTAGIPSVIP